MITRAHIRRQLRKNGGIMNVASRTIGGGGYTGIPMGSRTGFGIIDDIKDRVRKLIPKEIAKVSSVAAPFVAPFNPALAAGMAGLGSFQQQGNIGRALRAAALNYGGGQAARYLGGAGFQGNPFTKGGAFRGGLEGFKGGFSSPLSASRSASLFGTPQGSIGTALHGTGEVADETPGILGKLGLTKGGGSMKMTPLGMISGASLLTYFMQKGKTEEEAEDLAQDVYRGKGLGLDLIKADIKKYRTGALSGSQMFDKGYHFLTPRDYIGAAGGRVKYADGPKKMNQDGLEFIVPVGQSQEKAFYDAIINDVDGIMSDERKDEWLRLLVPQLIESGEMSREEKKELGFAKGGRIGLYAGGNGTPLPEDPTKPINPWAPRPKEGIKSLEAGASSIKVKGDVRPENMKVASINEKVNKYMELKKDLENAGVSPKDAHDFAVKESGVGAYMEKRMRTIPIDIDEMAQGGRIGKLGGGMPRIPMGMPRVNAGGIRELDYRQSGGFVPMGVKEKADDVPAMLSKNEFVMTADAVRGAGGGSVEKGAQKMYDTMKRLEGRVV